LRSTSAKDDHQIVPLHSSYPVTANFAQRPNGDAGAEGNPESSLELDPNQWRYKVGHLHETPAKVRADKLKAQFAIDRSAAAASPLAT
jgi:hypothetical protein